MVERLRFIHLKENAGVKAPKWESELWHYLDEGDGEHCPLYSDCEERLQGGWCFDDNKAGLELLPDFEQFNLADYDFIKPAGSCRLHNLLRKLVNKWLKRSGLHCLPIPEKLIYLADEEHPIEVRRVPLKTCHGALWQLKDVWVVQLNSRDTLATQRFTLFHEAFHILAHCKATPVFRSRKGGLADFNEALACHFAGLILQPQEFLEEKWAEVKDLDRMAEIFQVSKPVMCVALKLSGLV